MIEIIIIYGLVFALAIWLVGLAKTSSNATDNIESKSMTFIIPFKNEAKRIQPLVQSFNNSQWNKNLEVIFVDDHSTDDTVNILLTDLDIPFRLLSLKDTSGKKAAIVYGVSNASHEQIHTLDADVIFNYDFLINISKLPMADLTILPVQLSGKSIFQSLNKIEFQWLQTFTFALTKFKKPILCNGANLSFSKTAFLETMPLRSDFNQASGDDVYLLKAIKSNGGEINSNSNLNLIIRTAAPNNFTNLISQRKRWVKKVLNVPAILLLSVYIIYHALPFYCLINLSVSSLWLLPLVIKIFTEWVLSKQFTFKQLLILILHQVYYVIYGIVLLISLFFKVSWK
ncbi:MAG: glycosyltransferase [Crocinitomicaceae bacterium]